MRRRKPEHLEEALSHGPYFHRKAERIHLTLTLNLTLTLTLTLTLILTLTLTPNP